MFRRPQMMKSLVVIISNPAARSSSFEKVKKASDYIRQQGFNTELLFTEKSGHARELALTSLQKEPFRIIAAGGDGTINEVINGMVRSTVPLAILPLGTTNVLAKEIGISSDIEASMHKALSESPKKISLGRIEFTLDDSSAVRYFCLMAGIGFDAKAVYDANKTIKKLSGEGAYILSGISNLIHYYPSELFFSLDGREYSGYAAIIGKASRYGGNFKITPDADILDPSLYICIFKGRSRSDLLRYAWGIIRGTHLKHQDIIYQKVSEISVLGNAHVQIDGDYLGTTPAGVTVERDALALIY
jgi:YegS/Rv2252/BmrU family lipid kinase